MMIAIEATGLSKKYGDKFAVENLNLAIEQGELFGLLGTNGAGKTTTIKMLSCLIYPSGGDATLLGKSILSDQHAVKEIINVSPQETAVAHNLSVRENLVMIAGLYDINAKTAQEKSDEMIKTFGLGEVMHDKAKTLSGGMQRRLSIAMALISEPEILFLDEPTLGLDVLARRELWTAIERLKGHITIILTTHYMEEAETLCDRIAIMSKGELKAVGSSTELIALTKAKNFEDAFVAIATETEG